jgi:hypothetical protein
MCRQFEDLSADVHENDATVSKESLAFVDERLIAVSNGHDEALGANKLGS